MIATNTTSPSTFSGARNAPTVTAAAAAASISTAVSARSRTSGSSSAIEEIMLITTPSIATVNG